MIGIEDYRRARSRSSGYEQFHMAGFAKFAGIDRNDGFRLFEDNCGTLLHAEAHGLFENRLGHGKVQSGETGLRFEVQLPLPA